LISLIIGDVIDINSVDDPPIDIEVPETGSVDLTGQSITPNRQPSSTGNHNRRNRHN
jgi:hypothetical protein